jgi:hypothetical protein
MVVVEENSGCKCGLLSRCQVAARNKEEKSEHARMKEPNDEAVTSEPFVGRELHAWYMRVYMDGGDVRCAKYCKVYARARTYRSR